MRQQQILKFEQNIRHGSSKSLQHIYSVLTLLDTMANIQYRA